MALSFPALAAAVFAQMGDAGIQAHLRSMLAPVERHLNIDPAEGEYLRGLVRKTEVRRAVEVGTSTGYSGIWIALGLRDSGGTLISIEIDPGRHGTARRNFRITGLERHADLRLGDALELLPTIEGPIDFAFLDAVKQDYLKYYEILLPKMRSGGVIAAHNVISHPSLMTDFLERIRTDSRVRSEIVNPGTQGISVSVVR